MNDIGFVKDGAEAYRRAEDDLSWAGYRDGKTVALFSTAEDAEKWLAAVDAPDLKEAVVKFISCQCYNRATSGNGICAGCWKRLNAAADKA